MKLFEDKEPTFGNSGQSTGFKITPSAKAFKILSSTIYKHKIRAVVRELVCNGNDSHIKNEVKKPLSIRAPSIIDPRFIVRDYGSGLSHEDMLTVYTTYFESTKQDDPDQTGALGLGSKSPFSYTPTFSVTSYFEGVVRSYQCMLSNGEPNIVKTYEGAFEDGDESGIEVVVPAKVDDIADWHKEIAYIMRPFKSGSYNVIGAPIQIDPFDKVDGYNDNWFYVKTNSSPKLYAIYGSIVYPLDGIKGVDYSWLGNYGHSIYVHFESGTLDFAPSREELSLDPRTVQNVIDRISNINKVKMNADIESVQAIKNIREIQRILVKYPNNKSEYLTNNNVLFAGKTYKKLLEADPKINKELYDLMCSTTQYGVNTVGAPMRKTPRFNTPARLVSTYRIETLFNFRTKKIFFLELDDKKKVTATVRGLWLSDNENHPTKNDIVITFVKNNPAHVKLIKLVEDLMGDDEVIILKSSELEEIRKLHPTYGVKRDKDAVVRERRPASANAYEYTLQDGYYSSKELRLTKSEVRKIEGDVLGLYRDSVTALDFGFSVVSNWTTRSIKEMAQALGIKKYTIVRPSLYDDIKTNPNVTCLVKKFINKFISLMDLVPKNEYFATQHDRFFINLEKFSHILVEVNKEFGIMSKNTHDLNYWYSMINLPYHLDHDPSLNIQKLKDEYIIAQDIAVTELLKKLEAFKEKYHSQWYMLNSLHYPTTKQVENIENQFKILKSSGF